MFKKICLLLLAISFVGLPIFAGHNGYYIGGKGSLHRQHCKVKELDGRDLNFSDDQKIKKSLFNFSLVTGYVYSLKEIFAIGSEIYLGKTFGKLREGDDFNDSNPYLKSLVNAGFDIDAGIILKGFWIYGIAGIDFDFKKVQGYVMEDLDKDAGYRKLTYFGGEKSKDYSNELPEIKQINRNVFSLATGVGVKYFFFDRIIVGLEGKLMLPKTRNFKVKHAAIDIVKGQDPVVEYDSKSKVKIKERLKSFSLCASVGFKF